MNRLYVSKKFLALFVLLVLCTCTGVSSTAAFTGVTSSKVDILEKRGVFLDLKDEQYNGQKFVTRGEFLVWVMQNARFSPQYYQNKKEPFTDIYRRSDLHPYVAGAWAAGALDFLEGKKKFLPKKKISRVEALQILFAIEGISSFQRYSSASEKKWKDLPTDPQKKAFILAAKQQGFIKKTSDSTLSPRKKLRLFEAVDMLSRVVIAEKKDSFSKKKTDLERVEKLIEGEYWKKDEVEKNSLERAAIAGMVDSLGDKYSVYLPPKAAKNFSKFINEENTKKLEYAGIGVAVSQANEGGLVLTEIFPESPAGSAGLEVGDVIIEVEKKDITGLERISDITDQIKGVVGTPVMLTIRRGTHEFFVSVLRKKITLDGYKSVRFQTQDDIIWITVRSFGLHSSAEFAKILQEEVTKETKGIIIDLRYNPGGLMSGAQEMLGEILPKNHLTLRMLKNGTEKKLLVKGSGKFTDIPLVVFQNQYSASASEIFSASIKDYQRGKIIGTTSFGKGIAQNLYTLRNGGTLKLTTSEFLSPLGEKIHHIGITPDILLEKADNKTFFTVAKRHLK